MRKLFIYSVILFLVFTISSCKKDSAKSETYFVSYTLEGRTGGSSFNTGPAYVAGQNYTASSGAVGELRASKTADCNVLNKPPCYEFGIQIPKLALGSFSLSKDGAVFVLSENAPSANANEFLVIANAIGDGTVTITEIGNVGGIVAGTFSVRAQKNYTSTMTTITGSFRLPRIQ